MSAPQGKLVGPFFALGLAGDGNLVAQGHPRAVRLHGTVHYGAGDGVPDALVELWQPDADGRIPRRVVYATPRRSPGGAGARPTRPGGTASPPWRPVPATPAAPFFALTVFARGLLNRLFTRAYLPHGGGSMPTLRWPP